MNELVGKKIEAIYLNPARDLLTFKTDLGYLQFQAEGDCCSESWIEHINGVKEILNKTIKKFEAIDGPDIEGCITSKGRGDHVQFYFYKLLPEEYAWDFLTIDMRNDSNGYYGGELKFVGVNSPTADCIKIEKDM